MRSSLLSIEYSKWLLLHRWLIMATTTTVVVLLLSSSSSTTNPRFVDHHHHHRYRTHNNNNNYYYGITTVSSYVLLQQHKPQLQQRPRMKISRSTSSTKSQLFRNRNSITNNNSIDEVSSSSSSSSLQAASSNDRRNTATVQQQLLTWAKNQINIQISSTIQLQTDPKGGMESSAGYGWYIQKGINEKNNSNAADEILISVPSSVALVVESTPKTSKTTRRSEDASSSSSSSSTQQGLLQQQQQQLPWYVQMALKLCQLDLASASKGNTTAVVATENNRNDMILYDPWLQSLPRQFDTPFHWGDENILQHLLQYSHLQHAIIRQRHEWKNYYNIYVQQQQQQQQTCTSNNQQVVPLISFEHFVWGCECARSRAFAGSYSGGSYNPNLSIFTLLLITIYVGMHFGTIQQAANGAGVVIAATILKDFVIPKFFKIKRYVICPMIDMTNHHSRKAQGEVAFEYFSNSYSLSIPSNTVLQPNEQVYISYGTRSNDQLLQYYGFVEINNPHDVYVMPPIREWDISTLEMACGRTFQSGRLQQLNAVGLLGNIQATIDDDGDNEGDDESHINKDGVVISRGIGLDPAILQALRVLVSSDDEWNAAGQSIGNFSVERNRDNEQCARLVARTAIEMELSSKATTLEEDIALLQRMDTMSRMMADSSTEERLAIQFRIEKKRLLQETIELLQQ